MLLQSGGSILGALVPPAISSTLGSINISKRKMVIFDGSQCEQPLLHILENMVPETVSDAICCRGIMRWGNRKRLNVDGHTPPRMDLTEMLAYISIS